MRWPCLAVTLLLLAGCAGPSPPAGPGIPPEWRACRWTDAGGQPVDCAGSATALAARFSPGPEWACTFELSVPQGTFRLLRSLVTGELGLAYGTPAPQEASGVVALDLGGGQTALFNWSSQGSVGAFALGIQAPASARLTLAVYAAALRTDDPRLAAARLHQAWSLAGGRLVVVQHADTQAGQFLFYNVTRSPLGDTSSAYSFTQPDAPYSLAFDMKYLLSAQDLSVMPSVPSPLCSAVLLG